MTQDTTNSYKSRINANNQGGNVATPPQTPPQPKPSGASVYNTGTAGYAKQYQQQNQNYGNNNNQGGYQKNYGNNNNKGGYQKNYGNNKGGYQKKQHPPKVKKLISPFGKQERFSLVHTLFTQIVRYHVENNLTNEEGWEEKCVEHAARLSNKMINRMVEEQRKFDEIEKAYMQAQEQALKEKENQQE